jgi:Flp pilus assembly pilin Flp
MVVRRDHQGQENRMRDVASAAAELLQRFAAGDEGQDLLEYGLLASLIATFVIGAVDQLGDHVGGVLWAAIAQTQF